MAYAILRIGKLKTFGNISAAGKHNLRLRECRNADPTRKRLNVNLIDGGQELVATVKARLAEVGIKKWRKDAVLASEVLLTASPEFFEDGRALEPWIAENRRWLVETFGANIVSAVVHMDETTPHIHCILVPVKDGRLSHKNVFGGARDALAEWQTQYASRMAQFGLERGVAGSTARHEKIKQFYTAVNTTPAAVLSGMPVRPDIERDAMTVGVFKRGKVVPVDKTLDRLRLYRAKVRAYIADVVRPLHVQVERLKREVGRIERALRSSRERIDQAEAHAANLQDELDQRQQTTDRLLSFISVAKRLSPDLVAKVTQEQARIANAELPAGEQRSEGVKGALAPLGTHSTLLAQRVGSFGRRAQVKSRRATSFKPSP